MAQTLHHPIDVPEWVAGQMIDNPMQYVSPLHLIRRERIMPRVFAPHDGPLLTREQGKLPQNAANLPNRSIMGIKICDWNSKKQEASVGSKRLSLIFSTAYYLTSADRDPGAWGNLF